MLVFSEKEPVRLGGRGAGLRLHFGCSSELVLLCERVFSALALVGEIWLLLGKGDTNTMREGFD